MKPVLFMLIGLSLALLLAAGLMELTVRLMLPQYAQPAPLRITFDTERGIPRGPINGVIQHRHHLGDYDVTVRLNRHGLRDIRDIAVGGASDIYVVGDSFAFGYGVEQSARFSDRLATLLGRTVFNLGMPSTDFRGYEQLMDYARRQGAVIERIVLSVCMENDLSYYGAARSEAMPRDSELSNAKIFLAEHSALYRFMRVGLLSIPSIADTLAQWGLIGQPVTQSYDEQRLEASAGRLANLLGSLDALVVLIPARAQWLGVNQEVEERIHKRFGELLAQLGIRVLDLKPVFEAGGDPLALHFLHDGHWTAEGHQRVAEQIALALQESADPL